MQSRLDEELKALLEESIDLTWNEYCKTCQAENKYCGDCVFSKGMKEPSEYLSMKDMMLLCEYESHDYGDQ